MSLSYYCAVEGCTQNATRTIEFPAIEWKADLCSEHLRNLRTISIRQEDERTAIVRKQQNELEDYLLDGVAR